MKKPLFLAIALLLFACNDEHDTEVPVQVHPRTIFSSLIINETKEGAASGIKRTFEYENGELSVYTSEQSDRVISFKVSASAGSYGYQCLLNGKNYFKSTYYAKDSSPAATADFIYDDGDPRHYKMEYTTIDGKQYIASITELIMDNVYYVLTLDYSRFASGEIGLTQTLLGNDRVQATFGITRDNETGIPDMHLYDADLHPLDKHFEAIYGGLLGTFDYYIATVQKETKTLVTTTKETITSSVEFDSDGYPQRMTSVSDNNTKAVKYYEFEYYNRK